MVRKFIKIEDLTTVFQLGKSDVAGKVIVYTADCLPAIQDLLKRKCSSRCFS